MTTLKAKKELSQTKLEDEAGDSTSTRKDKIYSGGYDLTRPLTYDPPTDEELEKVAKATYNTTLKEAVKAAEEQAESDKKTLYKSINDKIADSDQYKNTLSENYEKAKSNLEEAALKRGIQRSSAVINGIGSLEADKLNAIKSADAKLKSDIDKINEEITQLESDLGKQIAGINEKYANAVTVRLNQLKKERDEKLTEVIKYNNSLDLFYPDEYYDSQSSYENIDLDNINPRYKERIDEVIKDYLAFSPDEAYDLFTTNPSVKDYLGKYYDYVLNVLKTNKDNSQS